MRTRTGWGARIVAALAVCCLGLTACGGGGGNEEAPDVKTWQDDIKGGPLEVGVLPAKGTPGYTFLQDLATGLEKDHKGTDVKLTFANTKARPGLEQRWRSGDAPDVDYGMFDATDPNLQDWANDDFLLDLAPYLKQKDPATGKPWLDSFTPSVVQFMKAKDGGIYGIPSELSIHALFYNKKLFADNGIKAPSTWDELLAANAKLTKAGVDPIALTGGFEPYMGMWSDHLWLRTVGYDKARAVLTGGKGHITDDPGFLDGLEKLQQLRDDKAFLEGFEGTDFTAAQAQFFQGKAGMILMGSWLVSEMKEVIPKDFELGVIPFPSVSGGAGDQKTVMAAAQNLSISAESKVQPLALEWCRRITSVETQTARGEKTGEVSAVQGVESPPGLEGIDKVIKDADKLQPRDYGISTSKAKDIIYPEISRLLFGKQDADETLQRLDKALRRYHKN